jgi:hypothetical protein
MSTAYYNVPNHRITTVKVPIFLAIGASVVALSVAGCQSAPQARVVRLVQNTNSADWRLNVNGINQTAALSNSELTNEITHLGLRQGDLILLGSLPNGQTNSGMDIWDWMSCYCNSNSVVVYMYGIYAVVPGADVFTVPVYHWSAPYNRPQNLATAAFFREGKYLGTGMNGFQNMLRSIVSTRPRKILILGSLYNIYSSYGPHVIPYEGKQELLDDVLKKTGTEVVILDPAYGF